MTREGMAQALERLLEAVRTGDGDDPAQWAGKLCVFWGDDPSRIVLGLLGSGYPYHLWGSSSYFTHCRPATMVDLQGKLVE
jgi:hypothetical protein